MEEDMPIDIHYNKLLDWLINRRHCQNNWQDENFKIRKLINVAIQDMPPVDEIMDLLRGNFINYFHCRRIVELLKESEGSAKTLFGSYCSKRINDWSEILKNYEKNNIYLAESAQLLTRYVNFEIPALRRQIAKCTQLQQDYARKEIEHSKSSQEMNDKFKASCKQFGIEGKNVQKELSLLVLDLPRLLNDVMILVSALGDLIQYYQEFVAFLSTNPKRDMLPMLCFLLRNGNTTVYEYKHGEKPIRIETNLMMQINDVAEEAADEIDWTIIDGNAEIKDEIDFGDLDIKIIEDSGTTESRDLDKEICEGVARGTDAFLLLEHFDTRELFLNDLYELDAFLRQRLSDLSSRNDHKFLTNYIFENAPRSLHKDEAQIETMLSRVNQVIDAFKQPLLRDLLLIRSFPRHVDRIANNLKKLKSDSEKMSSMSRLMAVRHEEVTINLIKLEPQFQMLRQNIKILQKQISKEISTRYKDRRVNIMGEINLI